MASVLKRVLLLILSFSEARGQVAWQRKGTRLQAYPVDIMFRSRIPFIFALLLVLIASVLYRTVAEAADQGNEKLPADPQITAALMQVSAQRIQGDIEKLVGFQTRLTLSAQDPESIKAGHGIGAAREWIKDEFERYSRDCGGCLEVKTEVSPKPPPTGFPSPP